MAKTKLPDPLRRRHLVEGGVDPGRALQIAEVYLEEGRSIEAVAFLLRRFDFSFHYKCLTHAPHAR